MNRKRTIIIVILALLLIAAVLLGIFLPKSGGGDKAGNAPEETGQVTDTANNGTEDGKTDGSTEDGTNTGGTGFTVVQGELEGKEDTEDGVRYGVKEGKEPPVITVTDQTLVFDNAGNPAQLKEGDDVTAYTAAKNAATDKSPVEYYPDVVIVETDKNGTARVGSFDENLLDKQLELKLNVGDATAVESSSGKEVTADDLKNQNLLVFSNLDTTSVPAQTTPEKVILLDGGNAADGADADAEDSAALKAKIEQMMEDDHYMEDGVKMVPLRILAEALGYQVDSTSVGAIVSKGTDEYTITRGQKDYSYNRTVQQFEITPDLRGKTKTYVPSDFIEGLMK